MRNYSIEEMRELIRKEQEGKLKLYILPNPWPNEEVSEASEERRKQIEEVVDRIVKEYGDVLKRL